MINRMIFPFLKKHFGYFISMILVSLFSITLLSSLTSSIYDLRSSFDKYKEDYKTMDVMISTDSFSKNKVDLENIDGIDEVTYRYTIDTYLGYIKKSEERIIYSRIYTYTDSDSLIKRYTYEKGEFKEKLLNVSIAKKFADLNNLKLNDTIHFYVNNIAASANIYEIVDLPETVFVRSTNYIWQDNKDFGYIYVNNGEIERASLPFKDYRNQILLTIKDGFNKGEVKNNVESYLENNGIKIKESITEEESLYDGYIHRSIKQIRVSAIFIPAFFYVFTLIIIVLFMNQIIKSMTKEIGVMISIGIKRREIYGLFSLFIIIVSIISCILGNIMAIFITRFITRIFIDTYSMPVMSRNINIYFVLLSNLSLILIGQLSCFISCKKILNLTPTMAMNNNKQINSKKSKLAIKLTKNRGVNFTLAINSMFKNKKRFFVSLFSVFATISIVLLSLQFNYSVDRLLEHTIDERLSFDCQIFSNKKMSDSFIENLSKQDFVEEMDVCYFTYIKAEANNNEYYLKTLALPLDNKTLFIPNNDNKRINISSEGIILAHNDAKNLGVKKGDTIIINNKKVVVTDISRQYFNMTEYLSTNQMEELEIEYTTSILINTNSENKLLRFLAENENGAIAVFSTSIGKDLTNRFSSISIITTVLIIFSLLIGFSILSIMGLNQLNDDSKNISIMNSIGFRIKDISIYWLIQDLIYLLISIITAVPITLIVTKGLLKYISSNGQIYPFELSFKIIIMSIVFVIFVMLLSHTISMIKISKWNLADKTRLKE